jgi:hypothetical protein
MHVLHLLYTALTAKRTTGVCAVARGLNIGPQVLEDVQQGLKWSFVHSTELVCGWPRLPKNRRQKRKEKKINR